jgi:hypothetical protein
MEQNNQAPGQAKLRDDRKLAAQPNGAEAGTETKIPSGTRAAAFSTKIHLRTNAKGNPLTFDITSGDAHDAKFRRADEAP